MSLYAVLGIPSDADEETIRRAYRILARRYHPDRGAGSSPEKFRQIALAYETLGDRERRRSYDLSSPSHRPAMAARVESIYQHESPGRPSYRYDPMFMDRLLSLLFSRW